MSDLLKISKILVTGGAGFLGAHVVTNLQAGGDLDQRRTASHAVA